MTKAILTSRNMNYIYRFPLFQNRSFSSRILATFFIPLCIAGFFSSVNAQFTQWQQGAASDYNLNLNWSVNTNGPGCNCWDPDFFFVWIAGSPNFLLGSASYPHASPQTKSTSHPLGPNRSHNFFGSMSLGGYYDIFPGDCAIPTCTGGYNSSSIAMQTALPYTPTLGNPTWNANGSTTLNWTNNSHIPVAMRTTEIYQNDVLIASVPGGNTSYTVGCAMPNDVLKLYTKFSGTVGGQTYSVTGNFVSYTIPNPRPLPVPPPMGKIQGQVTTLLGNSPVSGVTVTAVLQNPGAITNGACWPTTYSAVSDANGDYAIPFIYWGEGGDVANYLITPTLPLHGFNPAQIVRPLQDGDFIKTQHFKDTTSFIVAGTVLDANSCGLDSVYITGSPGPVIPVYTQADGSYNLVVPEVGNYTVTASYKNQVIGTKNIVVTSHTSGHNFAYTSTDTLRGFVGAGCYEYIGQFTLQAKTQSGCVLQTINTNPSGYFDMILPSRKITLEIIEYNPQGSELDENTVMSQLDGERPIHLDSTTVLDIFYRKPISIELYGWPTPPCAAMQYPVLKQGITTAIAILVWEEPNVCFADTGYVVVQDNISTSSLESTYVDTIPVSNGVAVYTFTPGEPHLASPYLKNITFTAYVDEQITSVTRNAVVSGSRQRTATFTTGAPTSLPFLILRDPPGDRSKSFFSQDTTRTYTQTYSSQASGGVKVWARAKVGIDIFSVKIWGQIQGAISIGGSALSSEESLVQMTSHLSVETSSDESVVGEGGDIIMGAAVNFIYGLADVREFDLNTCSIVLDTALIFSPDTFSTTFILTVDGIRNSILPSLELLANNPDTTEEARRKFRNEISIWEQTLQLNEDLKAEALANPIDNYTIAGSAGPVTLSTTGAATTKKSIEFKQYIQGDIAVEAGVEIGGSGGALGVEVTIRGDFGQASSEALTTSTTTGFTFDDKDDTDLVSFDYAVDPVYGTSVFGSLLGKTSCPHEPGTQYIDLPTMTTPIPVKFVPSGNSVEFTLNLGNSSESNNTRTYVLDFIEQSNEFGALVFSGANPFSGTIPFTIAAGSVVSTTVRVERSPSSSHYSFEGLQFDFYPLCEPALKKTVYLSAYFANTCSNISLDNPGNDWLVNSQSHNLMPITLGGYVVGADVDTVKMMYTPAGDIGWKKSNIVIPGGNLLPPPQTYNWNTANIPDGLYNIRLELVCNETKNVSSRKLGRIDRTAPQVFGLEEPKDDLYHPGDKISVTFKEDIKCANLTSANTYFKSLPDGTLYPAQFACNGNTVTVIPATDITHLYNKVFEAGLIQVEDLYGNTRADTVKWQFAISEPDSDQDGVPDTKDRCPGGNDFVDTDQDGLPDDCDCLLTIPSNGRLLTKAAMDFDGVDDYIAIPNSPSMIPTDFLTNTFEAWIYPQGDAQESVIAASGTSPNANYLIYLSGHTLKVSTATTPLLSSTAQVPFHTWTHIAVVFAMTEIRLYINGELDQTITGNLPATNLGHVIALGNQSSGTPSSWNYFGKMDEVRFWHTARTQEEIAGNMHREMRGSEIGLSAYYPINEGTPFGNNTDLTQVKDQSGNGHHGSMSGFSRTGISSNWVNSTTEYLDIAYKLCKSCPDTTNVAMDFDGSDDKISIPNHAALVPTSSGSMTIEAWVYPRNTTSGYVDIIASSENNLSIARTSAGIQVTTSSGVTSPTILPAFKWSHVAAVFEPAAVKIYVNGKLDFESAITHHAGNAGNPVGIGAPLQNNTNAFRGRMDDLRFWNHARTGEQIFNSMHGELKGDEPGLVACYDFNQGSPEGNNTGLSVVADITGNGHTGTPQGFAKSGLASNWVSSPFTFHDGDGDGLPDLCDNCFATRVLSLHNQLLDQSVYRAEEEIILGFGLTLPVLPVIEFRAPIVRVLVPLEFDTGMITISPNGCD